MLGAIIGDYVGSIYEMNNIRSAEFPFFSDSCTFTDDSMMTVAIAEALLSDRDYAKSLRKWGNLYPDAGYGSRFLAWVKDPQAPAYNSLANGSAMRVSPVGWGLNPSKRLSPWPGTLPCPPTIIPRACWAHRWWQGAFSFCGKARARRMSAPGWKAWAIP